MIRQAILLFVLLAIPSAWGAIGSAGWSVVDGKLVCRKFNYDTEEWIPSQDCGSLFSRGRWGLANSPKGVDPDSDQLLQLKCVLPSLTQFISDKDIERSPEATKYVSNYQYNDPIYTGDVIDPKYCKNHRFFVQPTMRFPGIQACQPFGILNAASVPLELCDHVATWYIGETGIPSCAREDASHPGKPYYEVALDSSFCRLNGKHEPKGVWAVDSAGKHACHLEDSAHPGQIDDRYKEIEINRKYCKPAQFAKKTVIAKACEVLFPTLRAKYDALLEKSSTADGDFDRCIAHERSQDGTASKQIDDINAKILADPAIAKLREDSKDDIKLAGVLVNWLKNETIGSVPAGLTVVSIGVDQIVIASSRLHYSIDYSGNSPAVTSDSCDRQQKVMPWEEYKLENLDSGCKSVIEIEIPTAPASSSPSPATHHKIVGPS